jgi:hypothetical protein
VEVEVDDVAIRKIIVFGSALMFVLKGRLARVAFLHETM